MSTKRESQEDKIWDAILYEGIGIVGKENLRLKGIAGLPLKLPFCKAPLLNPKPGMQAAAPLR